MSAIELSDRLRGYLDLFLLAKCECKERHECAEGSESGHPPDVPDQRKTDDHGKEGVDEARRGVLRHFDRRVLARLHRLTLPCARLLNPEGVKVGDAGKDGIVPGRWRRRRRPFKRAAVPGISRYAATRFAGADRHDELYDLTGNSREDDSNTGRGDHQPWLPGEDVIVLQAPRHAHQAGHIKRHESEMEADEPAPERAPAPAFVEREAERLGEPIYVTGEDAEDDARDDDVMEMGNQERAVVHLPIDGGHGEQHAGQAA